MSSGRGIDLQNRGALAFVLDSVLGDVAVRADSDVELRAVRRRDDVLGPVVIDAASGKSDDLHRASSEMDLARGIGEAHDRIGVSYVESISDECHPEWRMKLV